MNKSNYDPTDSYIDYVTEQKRKDYEKTASFQFQRLQNAWGEFRWQWQCFIGGIACWFTAHNVKWGCRENYEPDWCDRCYKEYPNEERTLPAFLNLAFSWIIERLEFWFGNRGEQWGDWLLDRPIGKLPWFRLWWEY